METMQLDTMRAHIISMIYQETNEKMLNDIELLLMENNIPPMGNYSAETLKNAVLRSRKDIRESRVVTMEEMRKRKRPSMKKAVEHLYADYTTDENLTTFTQLDCENFYEAR